MDTMLTFDLAPDEREIFLADVDEHLRAMEAGILRLERGADPAIIALIFRSAHTLKALAGTIGHQRMTELTHAIETLFDALRDGQVTLTPATTDDLLAALDTLTRLRDEVVTSIRSSVDVAGVRDRIAALLKARDSLADPAAPTSRTDHMLTPEQFGLARQAHAAGETLLEVRLVADPQSFAPAARLYQAALALPEFGLLIAMQPPLERITERVTTLWAVIATAEPAEIFVQRLNDIPDLAELHAQPYALDLGSSSLPQIASNHESDKMVRISVDRLDTLMNLVGELVTDRTQLVQLAASLRMQLSSAESISMLNELTNHLGRVVGQLQEEVMHARMLPIAGLFDKFPRMVRDIARAAGKQVELQIAGASTELDRSLIEGLHDPLIHLVRNAIDHGIEPPHERIAAGKPSAGSVQLAAAHEQGHIVITVVDDGRGIDPRRIARAAIARDMLLEADVDQLDDSALIDMIFWPRLSTATHVTELSGRGVGMDAVRAQVERLNGTVAVASQIGVRTTFRITMPLTLTIVPTLLVALGESTFALPLASIIDLWALRDRPISTIKGSPTIQWQNTILPLIDLRQIFAHPRISATPRSPKPAIVTVGWGKLRAGLVVDQIIGQQEVVVKMLSPLIGSVPGISGSATLGDGRIALIVDIPTMMKRAMHDRKLGGICE